jgi:RNA polymerase sigma-70 factor (ECF subfamily)
VPERTARLSDHHRHALAGRPGAPQAGRAGYLAELALLAEAVEGFPSPEQMLVAIQALDQIGAALHGLAEKPLQAFLLHYLDGQTHAEIALQLGVSARMIRKYLVQALLYCHRALG